MSSENPNLGRLRFARIADVPRIAVVATAGFYYSPVFAWERPHHSTYPRSTLLSYQTRFAEQICDPQYVVVAAEDAYDSDEGVHTGATTASSYDTGVSTTSPPKIVGVASWKLKPGSIGYGRQNPGSEDARRQHRFEESDGMDQDDKAIAILDEQCVIREQKYFKEYCVSTNIAELTRCRHFDHFMIMDMLVVHPAYWRRGHASNLLRWGNLLADLDGISIGVIASATGESSYRRMEFEKVDSVEVQDGGINRKVYVGFWVRHPRQVWYSIVSLKD